MAKVDKFGNIISSKEALKLLYEDTYKERLSPAVMKIDSLDIFSLKKELWRRRNCILKNVTSFKWEAEDIERALKRLKINKSRDPHGWLNEIFKPDYIGQNLKEGLCTFFNSPKEEMIIPEFLTLSNITSIYKKKGSRLDMTNQRGIFSLTILKKLLDYLIFEDIYTDIDPRMTDSNIGGHKKRMAKDHLFVLYGIINNVVNGKKGEEEELDIQIFDVEKAFDKLWLADCMNDLVDTLPNNKNDAF